MDFHDPVSAAVALDPTSASTAAAIPAPITSLVFIGSYSGSCGVPGCLDGRGGLVRVGQSGGGQRSDAGRRARRR
jgi:hypothetical protein